ncbi:MAG: carbohydrate binding family 9 domain-containing protein [Haliscomenobacter sp.]|nr:carbohydrate binding family 9 domain-containing protein [Haliscomenobacter sp.]MBP9872788.1 carbohydrate binding family 9 domain-containing protein [Haliscomenobacter sp.]
MKLLYTALSVCSFLWLAAPAHAQPPGVDPGYRLEIQKTTLNVTIDGVLDDPAWSTAATARDFWVHFPVDDARSRFGTEVRLTYNEEFLFLAVVCADSGAQIIQTLRRDSRIDDSDAFFIVLDPLNEKTNGFAFLVNAAGAQTEALISINDVDTNWDNKWYSATRQNGDHWTAEIAIPFRSLRFEENLAEWGINFGRMDKKRNEEHTWTRVPLQFENHDLGYLGTLSWDQPPKKVKANGSLIPFVTARIDENQAQGKDPEFQADAGLDAKWAVTSSLNLDLAVNPDFSQVEVDQQVTNLTRFSIFFPERRTFFLENGDIFGSFGMNQTQPFFSRTIGLNTEGAPVPILFGARLSGSIGEKTRIGIMDVQTKNETANPGQNYAALALHQRIFKRSVVRGYFLNRQATDTKESTADEYGRNAGLAMNLISSDGKWSGLAGFHQSYKEGINENAYALTGNISYNGKNFRTFIDASHVRSNYYADMGFVPQVANYDAERDTFIRLGYTTALNMIDYYYLPKNHPRINQHWFGLENLPTFNEGIGLTDWYTRLRYFIVYKNTTMLRFRLNNNYINLQFPFSFTGDTPLPAKEYDNFEFNMQYDGDRRKLFSYDLFAVYGSFYGGSKFTYRAGLNFRRQPWGLFSLNLEQNFLRFPDPYGRADLTLLGARLEFNFSTSVFWNTFIQYNTQSNNFNVNSRFQWRFAPMSDFFLVYTDNYLIEPTFGPKSRSLVAKLTYWLNL